VEEILIHFLSGKWMNACMRVFDSFTADIANSYMNTLRETIEEHDDDDDDDDDISSTKSICKGGSD